MATHLPRLLMFRADLETQKRHFERLISEKADVVPRGKFEVVVDLLRAIDREFPGLVAIPPESTVFAGRRPEGDQFNVDTLVLAIDAALSRIGSVIERPETLAASTIADPLARLAYGTPSDVDAVTHLGTRAAFQNNLPVFARAAEEARVPIACLMIDVDDLKRFNETYGHPQGDIVLQGTAALVLEAVRGKGSAYRYGGDEYVALLLNFSGEDARGVGERIRIAVDHLKLTGIEMRIGVTIGVAAVLPGECTPSELVDRADEVLLAAKAAGKHRTFLFGEAKELTSESAVAVATPEELAQLSEWLESASEVVRRDAARDLVNLARTKRLFPVESFRGVPRKLLKDANQEVRLLGLEAIGAIIAVEGEQASGYYSRPLIEVVERDRDLDVRARAVATIGNSGDGRFLDQIYDWIAKWDPASYTRVWPVAALIGMARKDGARVIMGLRQRTESAGTDQERARFAGALKEVRSTIS